MKGVAVRGALKLTSFLHVLAGEPVVTLSSAGRARISLKHGLGCTKSQRSLLTATFPYSNPSVEVVLRNLTVFGAS